MDSQFTYRTGNALGSPPRGPLAKAFAFLLSAAFLVLAFMFSLVALAVVAVGGLAFWGWLRWKTRHLRRAMAAASVRQAETAGDASIIEGEFVREPGAPERQLR